VSHRPYWFDPAMPAVDEAVLRPLLEKQAGRLRDKVFVRFADGTQWTYAETLAVARRTAAALQAEGVRPGDRVAAWGPNGALQLRAWFGANYLGAVYVPVNTAYRGNLLAHVIANAGSEVMIADAGLLERLAGLDTARLKVVFADGAAPAGLRQKPVEALDGDEKNLDLSAAPALWDEYGIIYTSGTTGPSKGVLSSYLHLWTTSVLTYGYMQEADTCLVNLPMFHVGGTTSIYCALTRGAGIALFDGFSASAFWDQVRATGATISSGLIGVMAAFLAKAPPRPDDADNPLRITNIIPVSDFMLDFARRFGFQTFTGFNMTEISCPLVADLGAKVPGSCGRPRSGVEVRLVDGNDMEVPAGAVGEMILRADNPWAMSHGYNAMPEATAHAWRNGWFHTGDAFRTDADGNFYFVDRIKGTIRRRGENVSSMEVEAELLAHPAVLDAAVVAVPADESEDEIMAVVSPKPGQSIDPAELVRFLAPRLAYFMVPRYVRVLDALPKTPTNKVRKNLFREAGITPDSWDRVAAGIKLAK